MLLSLTITIILYIHFCVLELHEPSSVKAVWISDMELFHVCWERSSSGPLYASAYQILDISNKTLCRRDALRNDTSCVVNLTTGIISLNT